MSEAERRVALITGCGKENGIGAAIAQRLASDGFVVVASDVAPAGVDNDNALFAVKVADEEDTTFDQEATVEEGADNDTGTFRVGLFDAVAVDFVNNLTGSQSATVVISLSGDAVDADFAGFTGNDLAEILGAIEAAAAAAVGAGDVHEAEPSRVVVAHHGPGVGQEVHVVVPARRRRGGIEHAEAAGHP